MLGPSVNNSRVEFSVEGDAIRYGLGGIKNVGEALAEAIVENRDRHGPFTSLEDLASRIDSRHLTKKGLESLIQGGACDDLGTRYENLERMHIALRRLHVQSQPSLRV